MVDLDRPSRSAFGRPLARNTWRRILEGVDRYGSPEMAPYVDVLRRQVGIPRVGAPRTRPEERRVGEFLLPPEGPFRGNPARSLDEPLHTVTASRGGEAYLVRTAFPPPGGRMGALPRSLEDPMPTLTTAHGIALAQPFLVPTFGERAGQAPRSRPLDSPLPTCHSRAAGNLCQAHLVQYNGESGARSLDAPLPTVTTHDRVALVQPVLQGSTLDIRLRMLDPDELAGGMGFPAGYAFRGSRSAQVRQIGNAVAVHVAAALCRSLLASANASAPWQTLSVEVAA